MNVWNRNSIKTEHNQFDQVTAITADRSSIIRLKRI